jgi:hypothetical protein
VSARGSGVLFDRDAQTVPAELAHEVFSSLAWRGGDDAGADGVDLPGVAVRLRAGHTRDDLAERTLDIVEAVALTIQDDDLVRTQLPHAAQDVWIDLDRDVRGGGCGRHVAQYGIPRASRRTLAGDPIS